MTLETFQSFLTNPPTIERLIFERTLEFKPFLVQDKKAGEKAIKDIQSGSKVMPKETELYFPRFQAKPEGFVFRRLSKIEDLSAPQLPRLSPCDGRYESDWWWIDQPSVTKSKYTLPAIWPKEENLCMSSWRQATEVLRLGIFELLTETLQWQGSNFTATSETGQPISGQSTLDADGAVRSLRYVLGKNQHREITYHYQSIPARWPDAFETTTLYRDHRERKPYAAFKFREIVLAGEPLSRDSFSPAPMLQASHVMFELTMDGQMFRFDGTNRIPIQTSGSTLSDMNEWVRLLRVVIAVVLAVVAWHTLKRITGLMKSRFSSK
ncbi:MAG: hypothetical protein FJ404_17490 [Verrucomicrobia bacterium]|nr:hypothetical protein [Verrucomicrobiota bacterium]